MDRKYVISSAMLNCQYGENTCKLMPHLDRHITVGLKIFANEADVEKTNIYGNFGSCRSPYREGFFIDGTIECESTQTLQAHGGMPACEFCGAIPWQNSNETVRIGVEEYRALMENGWTLCQTGMGIVSLADTGQEAENRPQEMLNKLEELEQILDNYMKENGIKEKHREGMLESVLLWNGYCADAITWKYESTLQNREFCTYLQKENPALFNYFERGLYVQDSNGETIDVSYMMGTYKAMNEGVYHLECANDTMLEDRGMYNGYLEAGRQETGKGISDMLKGFLGESQSSNYDGSERYTKYAGFTELDVREISGRLLGRDAEDIENIESIEKLQEQLGKDIQKGE